MIGTAEPISFASKLIAHKMPPRKLALRDGSALLHLDCKLSVKSQPNLHPLAVCAGQRYMPSQSSQDLPPLGDMVTVTTVPFILLDRIWMVATLEPRA